MIIIMMMMMMIIIIIIIIYSRDRNRQMYDKKRVLLETSETIATQQ
jgi:hypothetical protein